MPLGPADIIIPVVTALPSTVGLQDGTEVLYKAGTDDSAVLWRLKYDASITDAYKWRVVGAPSPLRDERTGGVSTTSAVYVDLGTTTPQVTVPLAGIYDILGQSGAIYAGAGTAFHGIVAVKVGAAAASDTDRVMQGGGATSSDIGGTSPRVVRKTCAAGDLLKMQHRAISGTPSWDYRALLVTPVRVG